MKEPTVKISKSLKAESNQLRDKNPGLIFLYIPLPNTTDEGIYVTQSGFANLLRANKNNPEAVQYLADMLE